MPEPICSASQPNDLSSVDPSTDDLTCSVPAPPATAPATAPAAAPEPNQSLAPGASSQSSVQSGVSQLVDRYSSKDYSAFIASASSPATATATANASAPTSGGGWLYAETHNTPDDHSALGAVWAKHGSVGHIEILSASVQAGAEAGAQIGVVHTAGQTSALGLNLSGGVDVATLRINLGERNDDGSKGANVGAMATLGGGELTVEHSGWSGTFGLSVSAGIAVSSGTRDVDGDGVPEHCLKVSAGIFTVGGCAEL
jgi:hypothetical protein